MSQGQKLSDEQLIALEKQILEKFNSIKGQLHQIQGTIDSLEGQWKGIGAGAFDKKQYEINTSMVNIGNILAKYLEAMNATRKIKAGTEDDVRAAVQAINVNDGAPKSSLAGL
ncbi:WXG100 family type VII secretion target [Streptomyces sp. C10-9-1]|uniref:WXG100 family type VII secretion target n=1 Tax=Streptomyces sanyensis TaxID=568869 RepID=A0ABP9AEE7_9ACTN|nr:WXG100 family type VII secretion target [Streptomyces sp. C10-9-1]MCQ6552489.1 WXG100 family type VII secretion target [Streptomyces sp. C10-9-1]